MTNAGPKNYEEVIDWPTYYYSLFSVLGNIDIFLRNVLECGVTLLTDFSGMGCPEMALRMLKETRRDKGRLGTKHVIVGVH